MFVKGDIVKVRPEWLDDCEKEDPKYAEMEYYVRDSWDGRVEVACFWEGFTNFLIYVWPEETLYKVGHIDEKELYRLMKK